MRKIKRLGLLGTGVIGGGWAARALHAGIDVIATDTETRILAATGVERNGKAIHTGRTCDMEFVWEFRFTPDGKLAYVREYNDTASIGGTFDR